MMNKSMTGVKRGEQETSRVFLIGVAQAECLIYLCQEPAPGDDSMGTKKLEAYGSEVLRVCQQG